MSKYTLEQELEPETRVWTDGPHKSKVYLAEDAPGMLARAIRARADGQEAESLVNGIDAERLLANRAYDTDAIIA